MTNSDDIVKSAHCEISPSGITDERTLELISEYTKASPEAKDIYIFRVKLCDNEIDRDFEAFSLESLKTLETLMKGKTGICDHDPKTGNQVARLYDCRLVTDNSRKTACGDTYSYLEGYAYMPRTSGTEDFITGIEAGIHKETSIGCAVKHRYCSVCGKDARVCSHRRGEYYDGKLCYTLLEDVTDAYEWSFVAVPAQREAGVMKQFIPSATTEKLLSGTFKTVDANEDFITLSLDEALLLSKSIAALTAEAQAFKDDLKKEVVRLSCMANSSLSFKAMSAVAQRMSYEELNSLKASLEKACRKKAAPQLLSRKDTAKGNSDCEFMI